MAHKKIIVLNPRRENLQQHFNEAIEELHEEISKGRFCDIALETLTGKNMTIVEGYIDSHVIDNGKLIAAPMKWYNKKVLDDLKIKY